MEDLSPTFHNLPSPDFDDTGFIGRRTELSELLDALNGPYPVITVIGEGGVGKSALALKACYTLLDATPPPFDAVVWVTAKATRLTLSDIEELDGAVVTSTGLIEAATNALARQSPDPRDDLYLHLANNTLLLVIDTLEIVLDENRAFVRHMPAANSSKVLITTRIGLGAYNFPMTLRPFDSRDSRRYFRRTSQVWGIRDFETLADDKVLQYCDRLQHNPLFIKWFVQGVRSGRRPESILANPKILLQFCLQNVFEWLLPDDRLVASALLTIGGYRSQSSIAYLTELPNDRVQMALTNLLSANVISMRPPQSAEQDATFALSALAQYYLANYATPNAGVQALFFQRNNKLRSAKDEFAAQSNAAVYHIKNVALRGDDDTPAAIHLRRALEALKEGDVEVALGEHDVASELSPSYFEVKRVEALIAVEQRNFVKAESCYEAAIALAPNHAPLRLWYAGFLSRSIQDYERALGQLRGAIELDAQAAFLRIELSRLLLYLRRFEEAETHLYSIDGKDGLTSRQQRQFVDLRLQVPVRRADMLLHVEQYQAALSQLELLKQEFVTADAGLLDQTTIQNMSKGRIVARKLRFKLTTENEQDRLREFLSWLDDVCGEDRATGLGGGQGGDRAGISEGRVVSLHATYGFLDSENDRLFFHRNFLSDGLDFATLQIGDHLIFELGQNHQGPCAVNVRLAP